MPTFIPPRPDEIEDVPQAFVPPRPDELEAEAPALTARISDVLGTWPQQRNQLPDRRTVQGVAGIPEITTPSGLTTDETAKAKLRADMAQARVKPVPVALTALVRLGAGIEQGLTLADRAQLGVRDFLNLQKLEQFLGVPPERGTQAWLDYYRKRDQFLEQQSAELEANQSPAQKKVGELAQGVGRAAAELPVNIAPGIGAATKAGAVLRSATAAGGIGGISTFNQERADGASRFEAATRGTASALVTAVTTRAFGATGVESIFQREGVSGVRNRLAQVFREAGMEGAEEMADQFQQDLLERISKNPSKPLSQSVNDVLMAGAIGSLLGGGVNAAGQLTSGTPKNQTFTPPKPNEIEPAPTDQGDRRQGAIFQPGGLDIQQPSADQPANTATLPQDSQPGAVEGTPAAPAASLASEQRVKADMQQVLADAGIQPKVAEVLAERLAEVTPKPAEVPKSPDAPVTRAELADEIGKIADAIRGNQVAPKTPDAKPQPTISPEATAATEKPTNAGGTPTVQPMPVGPAAQPAQAGATPVQTGSDQTAVGESLQAAWKAFDEQDATARDMADMLRDIENLPAPVKQAIQDLDQAREDDRNEFGDRSGLTAEAEDALINAVEQYAARPANQPQPAQAPQAEETYDLQPILAATTIAELDNVAGAEIKRLKTEKALQAVVKAMRKRAAELESQAAQKPPISAPVPPMQAQGTATAGTLPPAVVQPDPKAAQLAKLEKAGKGDTPQAKKLRKTLGLTPTPTGQSVQPAGPGTITVGTDARLSQEQKGSPSTVPNGGAITADRGATPRRRPAKPTSRGITEADGLLFTIAGDIGTLPAFIPDGIVVAQYRRLRKKWNRGQGFLTGKEKEQLARITALFPQNYEDDFGPDGQAMRAAYDAAKKAGIAGELFTVSKRAPQGGFRLTQLLDDIKDRTGKDYSAMELWAEVERLAKAHKAGGAQAEKESGQLDAAAEQEQAFKRDANKPLKPGQQAVKAETLEDVTSFRMNGQRMRVQDVQTDEGGNVVSVTLDDGNKYGTQTVDGETRIVVDDGTMNRRANAPFAAGDVLREEPGNPAMWDLTDEQVQERLRELASRADGLTEDERVELNDLAAEWRERTRKLTAPKKSADLSRETQAAAASGDVSSETGKTPVAGRQQPTGQASQAQAQQADSLLKPGPVGALRRAIANVSREAQQLRKLQKTGGSLVQDFQSQLAYLDRFQYSAEDAIDALQRGDSIDRVAERFTLDAKREADYLRRTLGNFQPSQEPQDTAKPERFTASQGRMSARRRLDAMQDVAAILESQAAEKQGALFAAGQSPIWRSNIEDALATWQNRGTPDQLRAHLAKTKGAMDEAEWIGLDEFLTGKASVTKAEVADFVAQNKVDVHEVVKGRDSHSINDVGLTLLETGKYRVWIAQDDGSDKTFGEYSSLDDARAARERAAAYLEKENGQTKFSQYQLPGGENYRELLLTLPHKANFTVKQMPDGRWAVMNDDGQPLEKYSDKIYAEHAVKERLKNPKGGFKSTHWDEPNVVAHVRFNERTDADGKRVLLLEEVQADWHQKGRKEGYRGDQETIAKLESEYQSVRLKVFSSSGSEMVLASSRMHELGDEINKLKNGVPNAPFKQTWPMLAMKRMIRYGSENGFDRIAWTTGEQQAERYDLSKQVSEVQYDPKGKELTAYDNSPDARVVLRELVEPSKIADYVGKDVAEKLLASPLEKPDPTNAEVHSLRGNNLKLGGEGMKGFYDRILPSEVNKFVKKWGGRVGQSQLRGKGAWEIYEREGGAFIGNAKTFGEMMAAKNAGKFIKGNPDAEGRQVHSLDITPAMREAAMQGMPMFATPQGSLTPQGWQQTLTQAIYEKYQRIAETGTRGATADSRPNEGRRFDGLRAGSVDRARRLFDRITALEPGAFAGARHDEKFYDTAEGRRFQALATRANAGVVFYAAPRTSARGCTQFGNIFLNTSQTAMERAQIFEHELAHVEQQRGNKQQRELMALVDLASDEAKAFAKRYNGWLQSIGNRPLTDAEIRMELSADLVSGRNSHAGLNTLGAFANQDQAMRLALAYHGAPKTGMTGGRLPDAPLYVGNVVITPPSIGPPAFAITAYHGTPHKVDRFSTDKIGTGEGAQVYGWGLYMAENPAVAEEYRRSLSGNPDVIVDGKPYNTIKAGGDSIVAARISRLAKAYADLGKKVDKQQIVAEVAQQIEDGLRVAVETNDRPVFESLTDQKFAIEHFQRASLEIGSTGNTYTVKLRPEPDELLDWDKPYSEQSPKVQAALRAYYDENKNRVDAEVGGAEGGGSEASYQSRINPDGGKIYNDLSAKLKAPAKNLPPWVIESEMFRGESMVGSDQRASKFLASIGIKGIRYADQFTRVADPKNRAEYEQRLATAQANLKDWKANLDRASSPTERSIAEYQIRNHKADIDHYTQLVGKTVRPSYNYVIFDGNDIRITHENGQELSAEEAAKQPQFAQGDFSFDAPESVEDQRARMAGEKAKAKAATARTDMQDRAAARLTAQDVDTTNEMFGAEVKVDKAGQGSLFASGDVLPPFDREQHAFTKGALRRAAETIIRGTSLPRQMVQAREAAGSFQKYAEETIRLEAEDVRGAINDEFRTKPERDAANARLLAYLQGEADLSTVGGPSVQKAAKRVRDEIDELSLFAVRSGMVHGPMAETWLGNTGEWLKRTYLAFDGAADWNYDTLKRRKAKGDAEITRIWNGIETYLRTQNPTMTDGQIEATMRELIDREAVEDMLGLSGGAMAGSGKRFSVETSSLLKRKKLAPEVREWMGEIKDPYAKLMQSGKWLAQFTARNLAQRHIAMIGLEMGVLSENKDGRNHVELFPQESRFVPKLDADGNPMKAEDGTPLGEYRTVTDRRHEPLSGYFTTPEFQKALEEFDQRMNSTIAGLNFGTAVGKTVLGATAWQKGALVGWNPFSWSVNSLGGFILRLSSGAVNPLHFSRALNAVARGQSVLLDRTATVGKLKARADYLMAVRAGLTGQGVLLGDIRANLQKDYQAGGGKRLLQAVRDIAKDPKAGGAWVRLKDAMNDLWRVPGEYGIRFADDVFRLSAFFDELELAKQAYPTWGEKRQIEWAGDRAANIYQTYDRLLKIFRDASRVGALNTFVSFKLEMFRNAFWIARYAKQGIASDNPALKRDGYQKAVGLMVMVTAPAALAILARGLNDVDDEEDKALKRWIVAPWDRSEALAYTKAKDGTYSYVPMGYVIPTYEVSRPFNSLWEAAGDPNPDESFKRLASGWMSDYFGPGAAIGPILEAGMNKRIGQNRPVTMREGAEGLSDRLGYVANNFTPRAFKVATESYMASTGQTGDYGRTYSNAEIATKMAGLRERTIDVNKAAPYVLRGLAYRWRDASTFQNTEERKAGENQQRIEDANRYEKETKDNIGRLYRQAWNDLKLLGVSQQALIKAESDAAIPLELRRYRNR